MVDLVEIGMKVDSSDFVKAAVNTKDFEVAVAKMVQTVIRETKIMDNVVKASTKARAEAEARVVQNIIIEHQKLTAAKQKEAERQQALAERQIKEEQSAWFAAQRRRLSLMQESQRIEENRISDEIKASQSALKQQQKEEAGIKAKAEAIKALAEAETAAYVKTTLAAEKAAAAKAAAFQKGIGGTLGLGSTNASAKGAGTGQAFIEQGLKEEAAERDRVAQATKREADQLEYLKMKYDGSYAAAKLFKSVQDEINLAMSKGVGNAGQLKSELDRLQAEYAAFGAGTTDVKNRFVQQAAAVEQSRQGVNKWGLLVQQSGYQAGDFLVQIQSGTNAFVAFGQQATQLVGILPMFAAELGISALALGGITLGLSIAIPLITAIGAGFMRTSKDTKEAKTALDELDSSLKGIDSTLRDWENTKAAVAAGITVEELVGQRGIGQAKADQIAALKELDAAWAASSTRPDVGGEPASFTLFGKSTDQKITEAQTKAEEATKRLSELQKMLAEQQKRSYDEENTALQANFHMRVVAAKFGSDSAQAMQLDLEQRIDSYNRGIDKQILSNSYSAEEGRILKETNAEFEKKLFARDELSRKEGEAYGLIADANKKAMYDETQNLAFKEQENKIQETLLKYGKDSVQVYEQKAELASMQVKAALEEKFAKDGISVSERVIIENAREAAKQHEINAGLIARQADLSMKSAKDQLAFANQEAVIQSTVLKFGKDSIEADKERGALAALKVKTALEEKFAAHGISEAEQEIIDKSMEAAIQHETNAGLIARQADNAQALAQGLREAATAMNALQGFSEGLDKQLVEAIARVNALKTGTDAAVAGKVSGLKFDLDQKAKDAIAAGADPALVNAAKSQAEKTISALEAKLAEESKIKVDTKTDNKSAKDAEKDPLIKLQKQIALQEELNGKTEAEKRVRQALGESFATYSPIVIKGLEEQIQKQIELEDRLKEQQGLYDTIQSSMEDAFMSMVDGTKSAKDAFKSMAAAIIKELYNVLVVQRMVGSFNTSTGQGSGIMGAIFKGIGGAFGGGSLSSGPNSGYVAGMAGRATGGPISAGVPYMVGERGPEMIIPKSSGMVLTNGQTKAALGGSSNESYVVHNNISVTGSDSMMVRQEIAKMIPQISSATKAAMIDAKRRGGQMGNAFR
jgi:hypothetical protein